VLHQTLNLRELVGLVVCVAGVGAATWRRRGAVEPAGSADQGPLS